MTEITVAALQLAFGPDVDRNIANVSRLVREGAARGAQVVLPPELFEDEYFCRVEDESLFAQARPVGEHPAVLAMQALAAELTGGLAQRQDFGMRREVAVGQGAVAGAGDHRIVTDDDAADRHFAGFLGVLGLFQRQIHERCCGHTPFLASFLAKNSVMRAPSAKWMPVFA